MYIILYILSIYLFILHILYIFIYIKYMCVYKSFSTALDKGLRKNNNNKKETEKLENISKMKWEH